MIKKSLLFIVGIIFGLLLAVTLYIAFVMLFPHDSPPKAQVDLALKLLDQEQKRLGVQCIDGDKLILSYVDSLAPIVETFSKGQKVSASDPIIAQGTKASDVMFTCTRMKNMMEAGNLHTLSNLALGDDSVRQGITIIRLDVSRTVADWCSVDCIQDAKNEILKNAELIRQRMDSKRND